MDSVKKQDELLIILRMQRYNRVATSCNTVKIHTIQNNKMERCMKTSMYSICNTTSKTPVFAVCKIPLHLIATAIDGFTHVHEFLLFNKWESSKVFIFDRKYCNNYMPHSAIRDNEFHPVYTDLYPVFADLDKLIVDLELREGAIDGENIYIASSSKQQCLEVIRKISASISDDVERYICEVV